MVALLGPACATPAAPPAAEPRVGPEDITRIALGSCADQDQPQPIWRAIRAARPDAFLFIGDNIYADTVDPEKLASDYAKLAANPDYAAFVATGTPILPLWDDHDYGANDAGAEFPEKAESQRQFLDFYGVSADDPRRTRPGVYHAEVIGPPERAVQVILLDTRTFRGPLVRRPDGDHPIEGRYLVQTDEKVTMLGEAQWAWLAEQLEVPAKLRILVSGIQIESEDHGWEKWMNLPHARARLFRLLVDKGTSGVILASGDRHKAELSMMDAGLGYPLYELTASGLNQGFRRWYWFERNRHRVNVMRWGDSFGMIEVRWSEPDPEVRLEARYVDGSTAFSHRIRLSTLQPGALPPRE